MSKKLLISAISISIVLSLSSCGKDKLVNQKYLNKTPKPIAQEEEEPNFKEGESLFLTTPSVKSGTYKEPFRLEFKNSDNKAIIFYTTDMENFDINTFTKYETPILIEKDTEVRFYSKKSDFQENVQRVIYKIKKTEIMEEKEQNMQPKEINSFINSMKIEPEKE